MSDLPTCVLPNGVELELTAETMSCSYAGDLVVEMTFGRRLLAARAGGDLHVGLPVVTGALRAHGVLTVEGNIDADTLHGREVHLGRQEVRCRAISATERIIIGASQLTVDILIAPEIVLDPQAQGRVTVLECLNDAGLAKVKGRFTLAEYEEQIGNAKAFLDARGLAPLAEQPLGPHLVSTDTVELIRTPTPAPQRAPTPAPPPPRVPASGAWDKRVTPLLRRIVACYGADVPAPVSHLRDIATNEDATALHSSLSDLWGKLVDHHQSTGTRPHPAVPHAFRRIHELLAA